MAELMTKGEAADRLRCSLRTIDTLIQKGDLKPVRIGRLVRLESIEIDRFVQSKVEHEHSNDEAH